MTQREVRIWSLYVISVRYGEEQRPLEEEVGDTVVLWPCLFGCGVTSSPREEKIRVVPRKGIKTVELLRLGGFAFSL